MAKRSTRMPAGAARRVPVTTKILPDLRDRLEAAAESGGRTLGNEIERRLERSFKFKEELLALFEDERTFHAASVIAIVWADLESTIGRPWYSSRETLIAAQAAASGILENIRATDGSAIAKSDEAAIDSDRLENLHVLGALHAERIRRRVKKDPDFSDVVEAAFVLGQDLFGEPPNEDGDP